MTRPSQTVSRGWPTRFRPTRACAFRACPAAGSIPSMCPTRSGRTARRSPARRLNRASAIRQVAPSPAGRGRFARDLRPRCGCGLPQTRGNLPRMRAASPSAIRTSSISVRRVAIGCALDPAHEDRARSCQVVLVHRDARARGFQRPVRHAALRYAARHEIAGAGHMVGGEPCRDQASSVSVESGDTPAASAVACAPSISCRPSCVTKSRRIRSGSSGGGRDPARQPCRQGRSPRLSAVAARLAFTL
jgi:hypothetical protein